MAKISNQKISKKSVTKKSNSKIKNAIGWFKPTTPAKGMLLFAIVFVVIGGSYMAYNSYASNNYAYSEISTKLSLRGASIVDETKGTKANTKVVNIPANIGISNSASVSDTGLMDGLVHLFAGKQARTCAKVRLDASSTIRSSVWIANIVSTNPSFYTEVITGSDTYSTVCTPWATVPATYRNYVIPEVRNETINTNLHVALMTLEFSY